MSETENVQSNICDIDFECGEELPTNPEHTYTPPDSLATYTDTSSMSGHSDTASYDSETLLIPGTSDKHHDLHVSNNVCLYQEHESGPPVLSDDVCDITDPSVSKPTDTSSLALLGRSNVSVRNDTDFLEVTPLNIIGSGWEFGSITSIHRRPLDSGRARSNTIDSRTGSLRLKKDGRLENRLLTRIFTSQIGSIDILDNKSEKSTVHNSFINLPEDDGFDPESGDPESTRGNNSKNVIVVSLGIMLLHIAYLGLRNLQSSMNTEGGIGVISMGVSCCTYVTGSFGSPFIVQRFGPKRTLIAGTVAHLSYIIANYYVNWLTIIPTSAILGFGSAIMWNSVSTYITESGIDEAEKKSKRSDHVIGRYFGIFFLTLQLALVLGNLISSLILVPKGAVDFLPEQNASVLDIASQNLSQSGIESYKIVPESSLYTNTSAKTILSSTRTCGIGFCKEDSNESGKEVNDLDKLFLLGTYATCGILSVIVLCFCLDGLPHYTTRTCTGSEIVAQAGAVLSMLVDRDFILVVPMCLYSFMSVGFVIADLLKGYITCPLGIYMVGYTMICFGLCGSISSYVFGKLLKHIGRIPIFVTAAVINLVTMATMVTWQPTSGDVYYLFCLVGAWGFADGIWQSQVNSFISTVFADRYETAFGSFRVLQGVAGMIVFSISSVFCMMSKLCITSAMCILSIVGYLIMEIKKKREKDVAEIVVEIKT